MKKNINVINEGGAYMLGSDGEVIDYKPGMKMGAFGQKPKISDDEKGVRGPLTILKYAIMQQDWEMVKQASDELESYMNGKFSQPEDDETNYEDEEHLQEQKQTILKEFKRYL